MEKYSLSHLSYLRISILSWGGAGYLRPASGTWGTLAALPFAAVILWISGWAGMILAAAVLYLVSLPLINAHERATGTHDDSRIVIDEAVGILIALAPAFLNITDVAAGFLLFRLFDGLKPGLIGTLDRHVSGAHGVLLDDVLAGALAALGLCFIHLIAGV